MKKFYRGIAVPENDAEKVIQEIKANGLTGSGAPRKAPHFDPRSFSSEECDSLRDDPDLKLDDFTDQKPDSEEEYVPGIWACGTSLGATYYAVSHHRNQDRDTGILVSFHAPISDAHVDCRDFLCNALQCWNPKSGAQADSLSDNLESCFGEKILDYLKIARSTDSQSRRIVLGNLAAADPAVRRKHYENEEVIRGRYRTLFRSAFIVRGPIISSRIVSVSRVTNDDFPNPTVMIDDFTGR